MNEFKYNDYEEAVEVISKLASEHDLDIEDFEFDVDNNRVILKSAA